MRPVPREPSRSLPPLPDDFRLGTATSAAQIEGAASAGGRGRSIWDAFAQVPGAITDGTTPAVACDHLAHLEADLDLVAELGVDVYRFSIAWPRIQPTGRGSVLQHGLDVYDRLVDAVLARGLEPWPTLYHWDLPAALQDDLGGWVHRDVAGRFADYAAVVGDRLGDRVTRWATLNEPWCSAWLGHERGVHAPGVRDATAAVAARHHLLLGHGMATQALRSVSGGEVGIVCNLSPVRPLTDREADRDAAVVVDALQNACWLDPLRGAPSPVTDELLAPWTSPELERDGDAATIAEPLDWFGVNYYTPAWVRAGDDPDLRPPGPGADGIEQPPPGPDEPTTMLGWHVDADGLVEILERVARELPDVPLTVTENGIALPDAPGPDGTVDDAARVAYLHDHLAATLEARARGVPVEGYLAWSLLDNFEWAEGYGPRFGLVHVDYATQARTPKRSYHWLRELAHTRP